MVEKKGLFYFIRNTSFLSFFSAWLISIIVFAGIYFVISGIWHNIIIEGAAISFTLEGLLQSIYASFLVGTIIGYSQLTFIGIVSFVSYIEIAFSILILLVLLDKIVARMGLERHMTHDKKINRLMLMMSIFRNDVDRTTHEIIKHSKTHISRHEIEALIDGLYVTFIDIERYLKTHSHRMRNVQYVMLTENIEDCLEKLSTFIDFLEENNVRWRDKSVEFWLRYILDTAGKIAEHQHREPKVMIALGNIKEYKERLEKKL